jgi:hypothetical protein
MRDGFRLFGKHPLPFSLLFVVFLATAVLSSAVPFIGPVVMLAALPLLSLGFMVASESALQGGPIHPGQFIAPLRGDATRRRSLLVLCVAYGALTLGLLLWSNWIDDGAFERLQQLMAEGDKQAEIEALVNEPSFTWGLVVRFGLAALLALPFWHAPALVHWGGQGPAQALFSSTLAVWRSKGAFLVYGLAWGGMVAVFGMLAAVMFGLFGVREMAGIVALPAGLIFSTVFYVSLLFTFNDSFGGSGAVAPEP